MLLLCRLERPRSLLRWRMTCTAITAEPLCHHVSAAHTDAAQLPTTQAAVAAAYKVLITRNQPRY